MAVAVRPKTLFTLYLYCLFTTLAFAYPTTYPEKHLLPRGRAIINNATGTPIVFSSSTGQLVPQGPASDGSGSNYSAPALLWIVFCLAVGLPLACAGIRGWRLTTGAGIGLAAAVCSWAAVINSANSVGVSDLILTVIVLTFSFLGFILGVFELGRLAGIVLLNVTGGLALGIRVMVMKQGLLFSGSDGFATNWIIIGVLGLLAGVIPIKWQRAGIAFSAASTGTFLTFLGIDLIVTKQAGMSRGLRFLFDRNSSHILDIIQNGYKPPTSTQVLLILSIVLTPPLAYAQHKFFKEPFSRKHRETDSEAGAIAVASPGLVEKKRSTFLVGLWDGASIKSKNLSRFSL